MVSYLDLLGDAVRCSFKSVSAWEIEKVQFHEILSIIFAYINSFFF